MGSTNQPGAPDDVAGEVAALARALRGRLEWHRRGGDYAAPGGASPRTASAGASEATEIEPVGETRPVEARPVETLPVEAPPLEVFDDTAPIGAPRTLTTIRADLGDCQRCKLCKTRKEIVFGVGPEPATLMFIGEGPGADEDRTGEPFVGKAGQLLDKMIEAMGWGRGDVYIANVVKCRPPGNRNPERDEIAACRPFLEAQITAVRPRIIVTLGKPAANLVLGTDAPISSLRGRFHQHRGVQVMPTFHPAYLLREPDRKRDAWSDLKQVMAELERLGVTPPRPPRG